MKVALDSHLNLFQRLFQQFTLPFYLLKLSQRIRVHLIHRHHTTLLICMNGITAVTLFARVPGWLVTCHPPQHSQR